MGDNDIYYVEKILDRRKVNDRLEYKIKWEGYPMNQSTWEPLENLRTAMELVEEYDREHPFPKKLTGKKKIDQKKKKQKKNQLIQLYTEYKKSKKKKKRLSNQKKKNKIKILI